MTGKTGTGLLTGILAVLVGMLGSTAFAQAPAAGYRSSVITNDFATNDISVSGALLINGAGTDNITAQRALPTGYSIPTPFASPTVTGPNTFTLYICSNGWISFASTTNTSSSQPLNSYTSASAQSYYFLPNGISGQPHGVLFACYADLDPSQGGSVYTQALTGPNRYAVQFQNVSHKNPALGKAQFVVLLYPSGDFEIHYGPNHNLSGVSTVVGMDDAAGTSYAVPSPMGVAPILTPSTAFAFKRSTLPTVQVSQGGMTIDLGYSTIGGGKFPASLQYSALCLGGSQINVTATPPFEVCAGPVGPFQSNMNVPQAAVFDVANSNVYIRALGTQIGPVTGTVTFTALGVGGNSVTLNVKATIIAAPSNDTATTATPLQLSQAKFGYTMGANNDYQLPINSTAFGGLQQVPDVGPGRDVVYSFIPPATGSYSIRAHYLTRPDNNYTRVPFTNLLIYAADSLPATSMSVVAFAASNRNAATLTATSPTWCNGDNMGEELSNLTLTANQQIFIVIDDVNAAISTTGVFFYIEVTDCVFEPAAPNETTATASPYIFGMEGNFGPSTTTSDKDFFSLGTFPLDSRLFAVVDGSACCDKGGAWGLQSVMRATTFTDTLEHDYAGASGAMGETASTLAGTILPAAPVYLELERSVGLLSGDEPYRLYAVIQPPSVNATVESEPNDLTSQANRSVNDYYYGTISSSTDLDTFALSATAGDLLFIGLDLDPKRTNLPFNGKLTLIDSAGNIITQSNDEQATSTAAPGGTPRVDKSGPTSPGEAIVFRVLITGTYYVRVEFVAGTTGRDYLLSVSKNGAVGGTATPPSVVSSASHNASVGNLYSYRFVSVGQPAPSVFVAGLPGWLTFDGSILSGTPTATDIGVTGNITFTASNGVTPDAQEIFQITVDGNAPVFTSLPVTTGSVGQFYSYTIAATGIPAPSFSVSGNPAWLALSGNVLSGTPGPGDVGSTGQITITASNGALPDANQQFAIIVDGVAPTITSVAPTTATAGTLYSYTIGATGVPAPILSVSGNPAWLTLTGNVLTGTPGAANIGVNGPITIRANNGVSPQATEVFSITVDGVPPVIIGAAPSSSTVGTLYSYTISATGIPAPTFGVSGNPAWLTLSGNLLSGTPTVADIGTTGNITVTASNGIGQDQQIFQISVSGQPPTIVSTAPTAATVGLLYSYTVAANGQPTPTLSTNALPSWLSFNAATGVLSGTPSAANLGLSSQIDVTASNSWLPNAVQSFQIQVNGVSPVITSSAPLAATTGTLYIYSLAATGNPPPTFSVSGAPAWLSLTGGILAGTPGAADIGVTAQITITATNTQGSDQQSFQIIVSGVAPKITSAVPTTATAGSPYNYIIAMTGTPAPVLSIAGKPAWLTLTGNVLSGTPTAADIGVTAAITLTAANGTTPDDTQIFQITVSGVAPTFSSSPVTAAASGALYAYTPTVAGIPTATLSIVGVLPAWLSFDPVTGTLSGTPAVTDAGTSVPVTFRATNGIAPDATQSFVITVTTLGSGGGGGTQDAGGCSTGENISLWMVAGILILWLAMLRHRHGTTSHGIKR